MHNKALITGAMTSVLVVAMLILVLAIRSERRQRPDSVTEQPIQIRPIPFQPRSRNLTQQPGTNAPERISMVWDKLRPRYLSTWAEYTHAYRLFRDARISSPWKNVSLRQPLFDASIASKVFNSTIHIRTTHGLGIAPSDQRYPSQGEAHFGYTLMTLADCGIASTERIHVDDTQTTVKDLVLHTIANYSAVQEDAFAVVALAAYCDHTQSWRNKHGQLYSFDEVCDKLLSTNIVEGACNGAHNAYALAFLLNQHHETPVLSTPCVDRLRQRLSDLYALLERCRQSNGGYSSIAFARNGSPRDDASQAPNRGDGKSRANDVSLTAHSLEWFALVPANLTIETDAVRGACEYLINEVLDVSPSELENNYTKYCHAGHALSVWYPLVWDEYVSTLPE